MTKSQKGSNEICHLNSAGQSGCIVSKPKRQKGQPDRQQPLQTGRSKPKLINTAEKA